MALKREPPYPLLEPEKPPRKKHKVTPIVGEYGRYFVESETLKKKGKEGGYTVDIFEEEETNQGKVIGTCACRGWSVRKRCSHLDDAREEHERTIAAEAATELGLENLDGEVHRDET